MRNPNLTNRRIPNQSELWSRLEDLDIVPDDEGASRNLAEVMKCVHWRKNVYIAVLEEENYLLETVIEHNKAMAPDNQEDPNP